MAENDRTRALVARPYVPKSVRPAASWVGIPGARHIPSSSDPVFPHFTMIVAEWMQAGIDMTDELMAAAVQLATTQVNRAAERAAAEVRQEERRLNTVANLLPPGSYGDAPDGVVYYIRRQQYVKIGTTTRLQARMRDLMPDEVLAVEPGSYKLEGQLHVRFAHLRISSSYEYFRVDDDLTQHIGRVVAKVGPPPEGLTIKDFLGKAS